METAEANLAQPLAGRNSPRVSKSRVVLTWVLGPVCVALFGGMVLVVYGWVAYGSVEALVARLQGYPVFVESPRISLGEVKVGETASATFPVRNLTSGTVTILGIKTSCGCMAANHLPLTIQSGEECALTIEFLASDRDVGDMLRASALLYLDVPSPPVVLEVAAIVCEH